VLARGRARRFFFALIACTLPLVLLAALETLAGAVHLSDRVAVFQDLSTIKRGSDWGPGKNHLAAEKDGFVVYRPWSGNGVTINAAWIENCAACSQVSGRAPDCRGWQLGDMGFRLADADYDSGLLQAALRDQWPRRDIGLTNFGIEDATLAREAGAAAVLQRTSMASIRWSSSPA